MSIIEKASIKRSQVEKAGETATHETSPQPPREDTPSLIEKAASVLAHGDQTEGRALHDESPRSTAEPLPALGSKHEVSEAKVMPTARPAASTAKQAVIDLAKLRMAGMVTPDGEKTQISEEFRMIKRSLLVNALQHGGKKIENGNLIMVTSSLAQEGKTFCAVNLAMSIAAERDHTVLLVDADVARPRVLDSLGLEPGPGLLDVLLDDRIDLADVLIKTNVEKLTVLPAGNRHRHSTELLASQAMSSLLKEIAHRYSDRIVIFDSPPLLLTSESRVLASQMGQIVLVVEAETTTQNMVKEALRQVETCDVVNLIFNKAREFPGGDYYGYYYK